MLAKPAFPKYQKRFDYSEYGGAPLVESAASIVIGHGRSRRSRDSQMRFGSVKEFSENRAR